MSDVLARSSTEVSVANPKSAEVDLEARYLPNLSIRKPSNEPRIKVIILIGINEKGSFHPMIKAEGNNTKNDTIIPLRIPLIFR